MAFTTQKSLYWVTYKGRDPDPQHWYHVNLSYLVKRDCSMLENFSNAMFLTTGGS
jgi:hypothetical protein